MPGINILSDLNVLELEELNAAGVKELPRWVSARPALPAAQGGPSTAVDSCTPPPSPVGDSPPVFAAHTGAGDAGWLLHRRVAVRHLHLLLLL